MRNFNKVLFAGAFFTAGTMGCSGCADLSPFSSASHHAKAAAVSTRKNEKVVNVTIPQLPHQSNLPSSVMHYASAELSAAINGAAAELKLSGEASREDKTSLPEINYSKVGGIATERILSHYPDGTLSAVIRTVRGKVISLSLSDIEYGKTIPDDTETFTNTAHDGWLVHEDSISQAAAGSPMNDEPDFTALYGLGVNRTFALDNAGALKTAEALADMNDHVTQILDSIVAS